MSRPQRNNVDYFPFLCKEGKAMFYIENKYGNDGYAAWVKILRQLAVTNYHYLNLSDRVELMFLASKCRVTEPVLESIINDLCELGELDRGLWKENRIIWCDKFVENIKEAYNKRSNSCIDKNGLLHLLQGLGILKPEKSIHKPTKEITTYPVNPQRREEKRREYREGENPPPPSLENSPGKDEAEILPASKAEKPDFENVVQTFHKTCVLLPTVKKLTAPRKSAINARLKEYGLQTLYEVFERVAGNEFFSGNNSRGWRADFDWIMEPKHFIKIMEGVYDRKPNYMAPVPADTSKHTPRRENVAL